MSWFKVDDHLHAHPKAREAGLAAIGMWALAGSWSMAFKTAGHVPEWWVCSQRTGRRLAESLVRAGLWDVTDGGWQFHDWHHYQPSVEQIERQRDKSRDRQRRFREKQGEDRNAVTNGVSNGPPTRPDPTRPLTTPAVLSVVQDQSPSSSSSLTYRAGGDR